MNTANILFIFLADIKEYARLSQETTFSRFIKDLLTLPSGNTEVRE